MKTKQTEQQSLINITLRKFAKADAPAHTSAVASAKAEAQPGLSWGAFDESGKLRAILESESEAYFYVRNRGHMHNGSHREIAQAHERHERPANWHKREAQAQPRVTQSDIDRSLAEKQAQHSPLPWHLKRIGENLYIEHEHGFVADVQREEICQKAELAELEANAAFIVRACNNAPRLADACKAAREANNCTPDVDKKLDEALAQWDSSCVAGSAEVTYYITEHATYEVKADTPKAALQAFLNAPDFSKFPVEVHDRDVSNGNGEDLTAEAEDQ